MIKKIIIWLLIFIVSFLFGSCRQLYHQEKIKIKDETVTMNEAIEIGRKKLISINKEIWNKELYIHADDINSMWKDYTSMQPQVLESELILNMKLEQNKYWAINFMPAFNETLSDDEDTYYVTLSIEAWVFIEKDTGEILGVVFYK